MTSWTALLTAVDPPPNSRSLVQLPVAVKPADHLDAGFLVDQLVEPAAALLLGGLPKLGDGWGFRYEKFHRVAQAGAIVGVAAAVHRSNGSITEARIGLTNMGATPLRAV